MFLFPQRLLGLLARRDVVENDQMRPGKGLPERCRRRQNGMQRSILATDFELHRFECRPLLTRAFQRVAHSVATHWR
jgi:hypothetical protein